MHQSPTKNIFSLGIMVSSSIGTILEWYDFSLFAFLTPLLAKYFFPEQNQFTGLMLTYAIFAIGFFVRPIGAIIFGHIGDRRGRKHALIYSILLMTIATFFIGLLPTYHYMGILAPILLIILRIGQGLSAGGESTGAILFVIETDQFKHRGFMGGLLWAVVGIGMLLGSLAAMLVTAYSQYTWAWRIPFLLSIFTGLIGYFLRRRIPESSNFQEARKKKTLVRFPLYNGVIRYKTEMLRIIGVYTLSAIITYIFFIFMPNYASNIIGLPLSQVTLINTIALTVLTCLVPLGGYLSDLIGRKQCLRLSASGLLILSYPLFIYITEGSLRHFIIAEGIFVILAACYQGTLNAFVIEQLPLAVRFSVIAVGYNIAYSIFGGTSPIIASYLINITEDKASPGFFLMFGAVIALASTRKIYETHRLMLSQLHH